MATCLEERHHRHASAATGHGSTAPVMPRLKSALALLISAGPLTTPRPFVPFLCTDKDFLRVVVSSCNLGEYSNFTGNQFWVCDFQRLDMANTQVSLHAHGNPSFTAPRRSRSHRRRRWHPRSIRGVLEGYAYSTFQLLLLCPPLFKHRQVPVGTSRRCSSAAGTFPWRRPSRFRCTRQQCAPGGAGGVHPRAIRRSS